MSSDLPDITTVFIFLRTILSAVMLSVGLALIVDGLFFSGKTRPDPDHGHGRPAINTAWVTIPVLSFNGKKMTASDASFHFSPETPVVISGIDVDEWNNGATSDSAKLAKEARAAKLSTRIEYSGEAYYSILDPQEVRDLFERSLLPEDDPSADEKRAIVESADSGP